MALHFIVSIFLKIFQFTLSLSKILLFSSDKSHTVFVKFIPKHFKVFASIVIIFFSVVFSKLLFTIEQLIWGGFIKLH